MLTSKILLLQQSEILIPFPLLAVATGLEGSATPVGTQHVSDGSHGSFGLFVIFGGLGRGKELVKMMVLMAHMGGLSLHQRRHLGSGW